MTSPMRAMIALQTTSYGMVFGKLLRVSSSRMEVELDRALEVGGRLPWRMELSGRSDTVLGELMVGRCEAGESGLFRIRALITEMSSGDRRKLREWLGEHRTGGTTRRFDSSVGSVSSVRIGRKSDSRKGGGGRQEALRRLDARRRGVQRAVHGQAAAADAFGLASELPSSVSESPSRRRAMGQALEAGRSRAEAGRTAQRSARSQPPETSSSDTASSIRQRRAAFRARLRGASVSGTPSSRSVDSRSGRSARSARREVAQRLAESTPRTSRDLGTARSSGGAGLGQAGRQSATPRSVVRVPMHFVSGEPGVLHVDLRERAVLQRVWKEHLGNHGLLAPAGVIPVETQRLRVRLLLPSGGSVAVDAEVMARLAQGAGLALRLDQTQRRAVARDAGVRISESTRSA